MSIESSNNFAGQTLRLGTRGSLLARAQSQLIANQLMQRWPGLHVQLDVITTTGDRITDRPLFEEGGKGLFTKELELALLNEEIDFAVHSYKDVPITMPLVDQTDLIVAAVPPREDCRDVVVMRNPDRGPFPPGAIVGTSSLRRRCQMLEKIPDARILPIRGNIDTRLRKLRAGEFDLTILALAGLKRANVFDATYMMPVDFLPAAGQGALALQCRRSDQQTCDLLSALNDESTAECVNAERGVVQQLQGDCHSPIAVLATMDSIGNSLSLRAAVAGRGGNLPLLRAESSIARADVNSDFEPLVKAVFRNLSGQGALALLHGSEGE